MERWMAALCQSDCTVSISTFTLLFQRSTSSSRLSRVTFFELLWPDEGPGPLGNRLSVALATVRAALDPDKAHPAEWFVVADKSAIGLERDHVELDVELFLAAAANASRLARIGNGVGARASRQLAESRVATPTARPASTCGSSSATGSTRAPTSGWCPLSSPPAGMARRGAAMVPPRRRWRRSASRRRRSRPPIERG
jgi:hypothetical protein